MKFRKIFNYLIGTPAKSLNPISICTLTPFSLVIVFVWVMAQIFTDLILFILCKHSGQVILPGLASNFA
ncbi:MAG: hypothetical protein ACRCSC_00045, partial [Lactococcus garvieae]